MVNKNSVDERNKWEEIIRSKLQDFEVDTQPDDWKAIESRLSGKNVVFFRKWYYAAAVIILFLLITGGYYYYNHSGQKPLIAEVTKKEIGETGEIVNDNSAQRHREHGDSQGKTGEITSTNPASLRGVPAQAEKQSTEKTEARRSEDATPNREIEEAGARRSEDATPNREIEETEENNSQSLSPFGGGQGGGLNSQLIADATPVETTKKSGKRWSIGAGGGSYSVGTNGGGFVNIARSDNATYAMAALNNGDWYMETPVRRDDYFNSFLANSSNALSEYNTIDIPKVDISHKQPVSFGIGVGYALNNRWSLQSGLVYTLLVSEWRTSLEFQGKSRQQLHFVGIPFGISYKIAEWNKLRFYATAGGMVEWNAGGNIKTKYYFSEDEAYRTEKEFIRMKELQWSVNARVGSTYPVIKFVNAYIEGGANYYFNNQSSIETIRSDKPFHVSLQAGLRFGF